MTTRTIDEQARALALARAPGLHADHLREAASGDDPIALVGSSVARLTERGIPPAAAAWLSRPDGALLEGDRRWMQSAGVQLIGCDSERYPPLLRRIAAAPVALYLRGSAEALLSAQLAIVGSRNPTASGARTAFDFAAYLARGGLTITSGLAVGIDAQAHEGALAAEGRTVAVLGCGLDTIYPPEHAPLAERIVARGGALVSEFPPGTAPQRWNFPRRNRLISGLTLGTLVVEAARQSGSLITARCAVDQGREVFAIPGSIHNPLARGCHQLLREGAKLVETAADVLSELHIPFTKQDITDSADEPGTGVPAAHGLDKDYEILLDALGFEPQSIDALVDRTGLTSPHLASMLLILELEGRVGLHPGGRYTRVR
ncbi:MAG TPA: DNA-processing protein DprA [Steroidobacteraceae bacterium]|nr:DNA-processing protein DprA [Steroidobacteraceae bacterium]